MRLTRLLAIVLVAPFPWIMAGCSSSAGYIQTSKPLQASAGRARTVVIRITSQVPNSEETTRELEGAVVEKLREGDVFERVFSSLSVGRHVPDVSVDATITAFEGVSNLSRELGGIFAGQATIVTEVLVRDIKTSERLGSATVRGESSKVTIQAIQRTAEQIAGFVSLR